MRRLVTHVKIEAPPEAVWEVLTDLEGYSTWNPLVIEASGEVVTGSRLDLKMRQSESKDFAVKPVVTVAEQAKVLEWLGHLVIPGIFSGRHRFELSPMETGTLLTHSEEFTGILVPILWRTLDTKTRDGFEAMNRALADLLASRVGEGG